MRAGIKDAVPLDKKNDMVYKVPCQNCQAVYIGETLRLLPTRLQEHQHHTRKGQVQRSAIAEHACSLQHRFNWNGADVIDHELDWRLRKLKEALHICVEKSKGTVMNTDDGLKVNEVWQAVL